MNKKGGPKATYLLTQSLPVRGIFIEPDGTVFDPARISFTIAKGKILLTNPDAGHPVDQVELEPQQLGNQLIGQVNTNATVLPFPVPLDANQVHDVLLRT